MIDRLVTFVSGLGHWAYLAIFLVVTLESAAFLGFVLPGETLVVLGGFLASEGALDLRALLILVVVGASVGDSIGYEVGRHFGRQWLLQHGRRVRLRERHLQRVEAFFAAHGGWAVLLGRFTAMLRALTPFVAGASRMRYRLFLVYNLAGAVVWSVASVFLGYFLGNSWRAAEKWVGRAGVIVAGAVVLVVVLAVLWRFLVKHQEGLLRWWSRMKSHRRVVAAQRRLEPLVAVLMARLRPGGFLGLYVTVGALVLIAGAWAFGLVAYTVADKQWLVAVDDRVAAWMTQHSHPRVVAIAAAFDALGSESAILVAVVSVVFVLLAARRWSDLLALLLSVPGGMLLAWALQYVFHRPHPGFGGQPAGMNHYSFPSGRAMAAVLLYGMLSYLAVEALKDWRWRVLAILATAFVVILISFSAVYLREEYVSDVLAAIPGALAWLAMCLTGVRLLRAGRRWLLQPGRAPQAIKFSEAAD
jgi:undecaprenyl-diphosphatase